MMIEDARDKEISVVELKATEDGYPLYKSIGFVDVGTQYHNMKIVLKWEKKVGEQMMKKVVIIGGGIAGMTAGILLQNAGFATEIYEKNAVPGGQCTGWKREGYFIDNCIISSAIFLNFSTSLYSWLNNFFNSFIIFTCNYHKNSFPL